MKLKQFKSIEVNLETWCCLDEDEGDREEQEEMDS